MVQTLVLSRIALVATGIIALALFPMVCRRFLGRTGHHLGRAVLVVARSTPEYTLAYVLPRLHGQFLAYMLYRWEIILRESAIFGIPGIATLGYYVDGAIVELRVDVAVFPILGVAVLSNGVDALSRWLRRRLRIETPPTRLAGMPESSSGKG